MLYGKMQGGEMSAGFWFLDREHKQCGPVGEEEFVRLIRAGTIGQETQMWTAGMSEWRMAGQVDPFAALFGASGPPAVPIDGRTASASPTGASSANPKLPLWDTIRLSYSTYFDHFPDVLRICWLWLVLIVPLTGIANWLRFSWMAGVAADLKWGTPPQAPAHLALMPAEVMALGYGAGLVSMLAGVSIAVAWHRRIILGEHPGLSAGNIATKSLWRYVLVGLAIGLIVILPASVVILPTFLLLSPAASGKAQGFLMVIPVSACCGGLCYRAAPEFVAPGARGRRLGLDVQRDVDSYSQKYLADILGHRGVRDTARVGSTDRLFQFGRIWSRHVRQ
jgi:hypothetical protein